MGFAQWFWRLFLVFSGIIVAHVLSVTLLLANRSTSNSFAGDVWIIAVVTIAVGATVTWYAVQQIILPLADLSREVRSAVISDGRAALPPARQDEVRVLTGAFDQMQRDLARRMEQVQDNSQRLIHRLDHRPRPGRFQERPSHRSRRYEIQQPPRRLICQ